MKFWHGSYFSFFIKKKATQYSSDEISWCPSFLSQYCVNFSPKTLWNCSMTILWCPWTLPKHPKLEKTISISFEEFDVKQNCFGTSESKPWTPRNQKMWCFAVPGLWSTAPGTISKCWCFGMLVFIKNIEIVQHGPVEFCCPLKNQTISCHACVLRQNCGGVSLHLESEMKESHLNMKVRELNLSWMQPLADLQSSLPREIWVSCHRTQKSYEKIASPKCSECIRSVIWEYFDVVLVQTFIFTWANNLWTEICAPTIHYSQQLFFEFGDKKMMIFSDANFFWSRKKLARDANLTYIRRWPKHPFIGHVSHVGTMAFCLSHVGTRRDPPPPPPYWDIFH